MNLIINYTINRLTAPGQFQYKNKSTTLNLTCSLDDIDDLLKEAVKAIILIEDVKPDQIKISGLMKVK
ncbi:hypothetical protein H1230_13230 [Paenibacillus sp. 19GGS1-52]|uniref:hypothetical protein n=1 Tax=Paenibacillus sp. 19GGS1-52 TaxID=2758563 RepID=UPI001EFBEB43|nr:hypothetical protein [Paenibacillus sp. 19GGS1-52]ULO09643.1 hypothetical protein H1230_13230 [Paenibacillus sp. 19GGS1-52]